MMDLDLLNRVINESGYKRRYIATRMNMSYQTFVNKTSGVTDITVPEAEMFGYILNLSDDLLIRIFLPRKLAKSQLEDDL